MTEALIGRLSSIHDLRVISRTSAMQFKNTPLSVPEIAKTLHIDAIVEGSVIRDAGRIRDRKSTRLNSSHGYISYAVFCLKKKKTLTNIILVHIIQVTVSMIRHLFGCTIVYILC